MTDYSTIPEVNALYMASEQCGQAIAMIDAGGNMSNFTIAPAPPDPDAPPAPLVMASTIAAPPPTDPALMADLRKWLVERQNAIMAELAALGVVETPPAAR